MVQIPGTTSDLKGALEMHQKAVKIQIACLGTENHTDVAISFVNIGDVIKLQGDLKKAKEYYLKAKESYRHCIGDEYDAFFDEKIQECGASAA